jgi:signal transduction histidine kinase
MIRALAISGSSAAKPIALRLQLRSEKLARTAAEKKLVTTERHYTALLEQSRRIQEHLRRLSSHILLAQEDERKKISRELHYEIGQILTGVNVTLSALKAEATVGARGLSRKIDSTQRLVEKSMKTVHKFARQLRPSLLDDLGLIPALHAHMRSFTRRTKVRIRFSAYAGVERLEAGKRTALYRVAQEALRNVGKHAKASLVDVSLIKLGRAVCMEVHDNGRSFSVPPDELFGTNGGLGMLGMRERMKIVGGSLAVASTRAGGTTVRALVPLGRGARG